ncbi:MAG: ABC transporter ATP-binding protein [Elusimicrobia bacterium]|nr:ABC transporter ATP-binding protein [Elusimicrobiota bacterium]
MIARAKRFLGAKVLSYLGLGLLIGISLFAIELAFAFGLQAFLIAIGALDARTARLPAWLPQASLAAVLAMIIVIGALRALFNAAQIYLQGVANEELNCRQRRFLVRWALWSESAGTAEALTLFNARTAAAGVLMGNLQALAIQLTSGLLLGLGLLRMAPYVTLAAGAGLGLIALALRHTDRRALEAGRGLAAGMEKTSSRLIMSLKNLLLLQILGTQGREEAAAQEGLSEFRGHVVSYFWIAALKYAVPQIFGVALICLIALASTSYDVMPAGLLVSYFYLLLRLIMMFSGLNQNIAAVLMNWPNTKGLIDWFERNSPDEFTPPKPFPAPVGRRAQEPIGWKLSSLAFTYPHADKPVFEDLSLTVPPGRTLVIVGPSGAGKSTLLSLMLGLVKPQKGAVELLFDAKTPVPLEPRRAELLRGIGYVGPESFLIEGTVRENLRYGLEHEPGADEIAAALDKAECGFLADLPRGLDHRLTEQGQGLSAGQKQRLSLARALLRRPRALILDEATSNLDVETEAKLAETLQRLKGQMTIVAVTHRQALLSLADQSLTLA